MVGIIIIEILFILLAKYIEIHSKEFKLFINIVPLLMLNDLILFEKSQFFIRSSQDKFYLFHRKNFSLFFNQ